MAPAISVGNRKNKRIADQGCDVHQNKGGCLDGNKNIVSLCIVKREDFFTRRHFEPLEEDLLYVLHVKQNKEERYYFSIKLLSFCFSGFVVSD